MPHHTLFSALRQRARTHHPIAARALSACALMVALNGCTSDIIAMPSEDLGDFSYTTYVSACHAGLADNGQPSDIIEGLEVDTISLSLASTEDEQPRPDHRIQVISFGEHRALDGSAQLGAIKVKHLHFAADNTTCEGEPIALHEYGPLKARTVDVGTALLEQTKVRSIRIQISPIGRLAPGSDPSLMILSHNDASQYWVYHLDHDAQPPRLYVNTSNASAQPGSDPVNLNPHIVYTLKPTH